MANHMTHQGILTLREKQRTGSKPRCHLLTDGTASEVANRLTAIIQPWGEVSAADAWMPEGFSRLEEAQLHKAYRLIPDPARRRALRDWWLAVSRGDNTTTPNWDVASTCTVRGTPGLLLIEAKAHDYELRKEECGKSVPVDDSRDEPSNSQRNHQQIAACIQDVTRSLSEQTRLPWHLSTDSHYQMSNRFAWSWKLTELGIPVILVYLGFLNCDEMHDPPTTFAFSCREDWERVVKAHNLSLFPECVWNKKCDVNRQAFIPLIRTYDQAL
jgi:hypothetical protein